MKKVVCRFTFLSISALYSTSTFSFTILMILVGSIPISSGKKINLVINVPFEEPFIFRKELIQPAIDYAIASLKNKKINELNDYEFQIFYQNSKCSRDAALRVVEQYYDKCSTSSIPHQCNMTSPFLLLGPICNEPTLIVATFAEYWKIPMITAGSHVTSITGPSRDFSTLVSITPTFSDLGFFIDLVFKQLYAGEVIPVHLVAEDIIDGSTTERECYNIMVEIEAIFDFYQYYEIESHRIIKDEFNANNFVERLNNPKVVLMCATVESVRQIMTAAWFKKYANPKRNHWYVIDLYDRGHYAEGGWKTGFGLKFARNAFQALRVFTLRVPTETTFINFKHAIEEKYKQKKIQEKVNAYVEGFHDAVLVYAQALSKTISENNSLFNGSEIARNMRNISIAGIGGPLFIDEFGNRLGSYNLLAMRNAQDGVYKPILEFSGHSRLLSGTLEDWQSTDVEDNNSDSTDEIKNTALDYTTLAGVLGGILGMFVCCTLVFGGACFWRKICLKKSTPSRNFNCDSHNVLREEASVTTCMTTIEEDDL